MIPSTLLLVTLVTIFAELLSNSEAETFSLVFAYGTLKMGEPNYHVMTNPETGGSRFAGIGETDKRYPLVVCSKYSVPFLLDAEGKGENVVGQVFQIDEKKLRALDKLEGHPDVYTRKQTKIKMTHDEDMNPLEQQGFWECWVYFLPRFEPELLELPYYKNYTLVGDHPPYVERDDICPIGELEIEED